MQAAGFLMLATTAATMLLTGLPVFVAMIGVASAFAAFGAAVGAIPATLLHAMPSRVIGLLETDLLQAIPLYVLMGTLLNRLPLSEIVFRAFTRIAWRTPAAPLLAGFGVGGLLAPMNGSVGASVSMLVRLVRPRLVARGVPPASSLASICAASTLGVVVPPSLVLILFGDAMMRAHTEALNVSGEMTRIINTQDVFRGAILPAAMLFLLFLLVAWRDGRQRAMAPLPARLRPREWLLAAITLASVAGLLGAVALGYLYAVEAAAAGACALCGIGFATGALRGAALRELLSDTLVITGALFALFLAATTFTLVFRAFGSDRLLTAIVLAVPGGTLGAAIAVLAAIGVCAVVLDAYEVILVIVPLVMPPLLLRAPDALWDAVLAILVLQASFLIPPWGLALMMARGLSSEAPTSRAMAKALMPYLAAVGLVLAAVIAYPRLVHLTAAANDTVIAPLMSDEAARRQLMLMTTPQGR